MANDHWAMPSTSEHSQPGLQKTKKKLRLSAGEDDDK